MFLNRKLIVQLSTSRFRPQPKESTPSLPQQLMIMSSPSSSSPPSSLPYHQSPGGSQVHQQQSTPLPTHFTYSDLNYEMMTSTNLPSQSSSSPPPPPPPLPDNSNYFSQDMTHFYSQYANGPIDPMISTASKMNQIKLNKPIKTGNSSRMV